MQMDALSSSDFDHPENVVDQFTFEFNHLQLDCNDKSDSEHLLLESGNHADDEEEEHCNDEDEEEDDEDDDDGEFTFMYIGGDNDSPISAEKVVEDGRIRTAFPLFDQSLLLGGDYEVEGTNWLPIRPPVDKVFIESPQQSQLSENGEFGGVAAGPYSTWSKESATATPELNKKSNSTGFSKLWRFREKVSRSNSDGRDAFVFLNGSDRTMTSSESIEKPAAVNGTSVRVNAAGDGGAKAKVVKKGTKAKKATMSAHEVYLRSKGVKTEEERRRTYIPYRPVMGFFTNVNGGLSRNVHPF